MRQRTYFNREVIEFIYHRPVIDADLGEMSEPCIIRLDVKKLHVMLDKAKKNKTGRARRGALTVTHRPKARGRREAERTTNT